MLHRAMLTGGLEQLASHAEVVMLDFAASMLAELERWMLTAGPAMIDLNTFCDTSDKLMSSASVVEAVQTRLYTDEVRSAGQQVLLGGISHHPS